MHNNHIEILKMGGTIEFKDPAYEKINDLMKLDVTIEAYLNNLVKPHFSFETKVICEKDSRDIDLDDRNKLWNQIASSKNENILITHGTYTMKDTAKFIEKMMKESNISKRIVITGAMVPIVGFSISDAGFNLGYSLGSLGSLSHGVFICMNGGIFVADEVEKNINLFRFE